jgi:hypothetical protein
MMATLNTNPGSSTAMQRQALHRIKRKRGWSDDQLHAAIGTGSTCDLSSQEASECITRLSGVKLPNPPGKKPSVYPDKKTPGVARMITEDQIEQISRLGLTYFGIPREFRAWLAKDFKVPHDGNVLHMIRQLATAERAGQVIRVLRMMHARRNGRAGSARRNGRAAPGAPGPATGAR